MSHLAKEDLKTFRGIFVVEVLVFLINIVLGILWVIEEGFVLRRFVPFICWSLALVVLIIKYNQK